MDRFNFSIHGRVVLAPRILYTYLRALVPAKPSYIQRLLRH
jgi:hypothetical protein